MLLFNKGGLMFQKISRSNKCCSFKLSISQRILGKKV